MMGKRYGDDYIEVRVIFRKSKEPKLLEYILSMPEVNWSVVAKRSIISYIKKRRREDVE